MAKTLKEALLEQLDALRERGLVPERLPQDDDTAPVVLDGYSGVDGVEDGETKRRPQRKTRAKARRSEKRPELVHEAKELQEERRPQRRAHRLKPGGTEATAAVVVSTDEAAPEPVTETRPHRGVTDRLRRRAEARKRERSQREQVRNTLAAVRGADVDDQFLDRFLADLSVETGVLPPLPVVVYAIKASGSDVPSEVAGAVRAYYRTPRRLRAPVS